MKNLAQQADYAEIVNRLGRLRPDSPRQWGSMPPHGAMCHLSDAFLAALGRKPASAASGLFQRTLMKWGALWFPMKWPPNIKTRPEVEQGLGGTPPGDFANDRARLLALMAEFVKADLTTPHPIFGAMTRAEWMRWGYLHMDHHLRQFQV